MTTPGDRADLTVTALYTAGTWAWAGLPGAELYAHRGTRRVFRGVNAALSLARLLVRGATSLRHALVHRHACIDAVLRRDRPGQVLELAAGLSPRGAALSAEGLEVVEVDLPGVVARKEALLRASEAGRAVLARPHLRRVAADVTTTPLEALLTPTGPAAVVIEGLLMYLDADAQRALWSRAARWLGPHGGLLVFDLVPAAEQPPAGFIGRLLGAIMARATGGGRFVRDPRTRDDVLRELREAGFTEVEAVEPREVAAAWGLPFPHVPTRQLVFVGRVEPTP